MFDNAPLAPTAVCSNFSRGPASYLVLRWLRCYDTPDDHSYHDDVAWRSKCIVYILFRSVDVIAAKKTTTGRRPTCYNKKPSSYISAAGHVLYDKRTKSVSFFISYIFWPSLLGLKCFGGWFYVIYRRTNGSTLSFGRLFMWYVPSPPPLYYIGPPHPILR